MSRQNLSIREARPGDVEGLAALLDEISELHAVTLPGFFKRADARAQAKWVLEQVADNSKAVLLVAEEDGKAVGLVHFEEREAEEHPLLMPRRYLNVSTLVVAESRRGSGIGKALMARAHEWGVTRGLAEAELYVYEFNRAAIGLYEGLGYTTRARRMARKLARPLGPRQGSEGSQ